MRNPLRGTRKRIFLGSEGMRLLWKLFPQAAFFEVYVPARKEKGERPELPLIIESTETRLVEPYTKMFYRLFTTRDIPLSRLLFINVNCMPEISSRVVANLAITLASEDLITYLIDLDMENPSLHELFHVERNPGMVEFLLKGADVDNVVRETGVPELKFIPSGRLITDPEDVLSMLGWSRTLDRLIPSRAVGLIYAGSGRGFDLNELMPEVDGTLLLFASGEQIDRWIKKELKKIKKRTEVLGVIWANPMEYPFRKMETPSFKISAEMGEEKPKEPSVLVGESQRVSRVNEEEMGLGLRGGEVDSGSGEGEGREKAEEEHQAREGDERTEGKEEPEPEGKEEEEEIGEKESVLASLLGSDERKRSVWLTFLGVVAGLIVLWGILKWVSFSGEEQPGLTTGEEYVGPPPVEEVTGAEEEVGDIVTSKEPSEEGDVGRGYFPQDAVEIPYSLILASYKRESSANRGKERLIRAGFEAYLVPLEVPGRGRWIRLMVGHYRDKAEAKAGLDEVGSRSGLTGGRVVESPLAYFLGNFASMEGAEAEQAKVKEMGIDSYIVETGGEDPDYLLYIGAFENRGQANVLEEVLEDRALRGELVERRGFRL